MSPRIAARVAASSVGQAFVTSRSSASLAASSEPLEGAEIGLSAAPRAALHSGDCRKPLSGWALTESGFNPVSPTCDKSRRTLILRTCPRSPADAQEEANARAKQRHAAAAAKDGCQVRTKARRLKRRRPPRTAYDTASFRRAITRAADAADIEAKRARGLPPESPRIVLNWAPNQLRHAYATKVRKEYGPEAARVLLGHQSVVTSGIYAERDAADAALVAAKIG
jgi:hypothetical protein